MRSELITEGKVRLYIIGLECHISTQPAGTNCPMLFWRHRCESHHAVFIAA